MQTKYKRLLISALLILICAGALFGVSRIKVWRTLDYGCLLSDEALAGDLDRLKGQLVSIDSSYNSGQIITVGYRGTVESADSVLKEISSAGGLIWREYAAGRNFNERVEDKNFRVNRMYAFLPLWFPVWELTGAVNISIGLE